MKKSVLISLFYFLLVFSSHAQNIFVNQASTAANPDGSSWAKAYPTLQQAIFTAPVNSNIWIAKGTYVPTADTLGTIPTDERDKTFYLKKTLNFYGGFNGTESSLTMANFNTNPTIISGEIQANAIETDNAYHIFTVVLTDQSINGIFKDLIFEKGNAVPTTPTPARNFGGAFYFNLTLGDDKIVAPVYENCVFRNNTAFTGASFYFNNSAPEVAPIFKKCSFLNGVALGIGGTVANPLGSGGALYFRQNSNKNNAKFEYCLFDRNRANFAGCIYNIAFQSSSSNIQITACTFNNNFANSQGGVMYSCSNGPTVTNKPLIINSLFVENQANTQGGVFYNLSNQGETSPIYVNCTFYKNAVNNTVNAGNGATMYNNSNTDGIAICRPKIYNSIMWNQPVTVTKDIFNNIATTNAVKKLTTLVSHCIYSDGTVNGTISPTDSVQFENSIEMDPLFINTADLNGFDNLWATTDDGLAISINSPAINAGSVTNYNAFRKNASLKIAAPLFDITGLNTRNVNSAVDLGAFEYQVLTTLPIKLNNFSVKQNINFNQIEWQTSQETGIVEFEILKKKANLPKAEWEVLSVKKAKGENINHYMSKDFDVTEAAYYQLKWFDFAESKPNYSKIVFVDNNKTTKYIIGQNPTTGLFELKKGNNNTGYITNSFGQIIKTVAASDSIINLSELSNGLYYYYHNGTTTKLFVRK